MANRPFHLFQLFAEQPDIVMSFPVMRVDGKSLLIGFDCVLPLAFLLKKGPEVEMTLDMIRNIGCNHIGRSVG
jgi:hypothetical protein